MKKVMILSALAVILGLSAPQVLNASPAMSRTSNGTVTMQTQTVKYQPIMVSSLPKAVFSAFQKSYPGYTISKAYKGSDGTYKLAVSKQGGNTEMLYYKSNGEFIKAEKPNSPMK